jgi:hypothetical protein
MFVRFIRGNGGLLLMFFLGSKPTAFESMINIYEWCISIYFLSVQPTFLILLFLKISFIVL